MIPEFLNCTEMLPSGGNGKVGVMKIRKRSQKKQTSFRIIKKCISMVKKLHSNALRWKTLNRNNETVPEIYGKLFVQ